MKAHCIIGNILEDFIVGSHLHKRNAWVKSEYVQGILLHRFIDNFTDKHELVLQCNHLLQKQHGKFAPVISDIFFDYFLSKHWSKFYAEDLDEFCTKVYAVFKQHWDDYPPPMQQLLHSMIAKNWLRFYGEKAAIEKALYHISLKSKFPNTMDKALKSLNENEVFFETRFLAFYPQLQSVCNEFLLIQKD